MTVKEQLNSIRDCKVRIQNKQNEIFQLEKIAAEAQSCEQDKVQTSNTIRKTGRLAIEIVAAQQEIIEEQIRLIQKQKEISYMIENIDNSVIYDILHRRYIQCQSWKEIAKQTGYSESHVYRLHKKAIEKLEV